MDPSLLPVLTYQNFQYSQNLAIAQLEAEAKRRLEERQRVLDAADKMWEDLLQDSTKYPERVWISAKIILEDMKGLGAIPETLEKDVEREKITFLWHTFLNIIEKCTRQLSPEQLDKCQHGIQAVWMKRYIEVILPRLYVYKQFQDIKEQLESEKKILRRNEKVLYVVLTLLMLLWFAWLRMNNSVVSSENIAGVVFAVMLPGAIIRSRLRSKYAQRSNNARLPYYYVEKEESFWSSVKEKFNGIPSQETLEKIRREQEEIIKSSFGKSEPTREETSSSYELPEFW